MIAPINPYPENSPESSGVGAGLFGDPHHIRADARLARRAMRWKMKREDRRRLMELAMKQAELAAKGSDFRSFAACAKVVLEADKINLQEEKQERPEVIQHEHSIMVDARISQIGAICSAALERVGVSGDCEPNGRSNGNGKEH